MIVKVPPGQLRGLFYSVSHLLLIGSDFYENGLLKILIYYGGFFKCKAP